MTTCRCIYAGYFTSCQTHNYYQYYTHVVVFICLYAVVPAVP